MKTVILSVALLVSLCAARASASDYWRTLDCAWRQDLAAIEAATDRSNALLQLGCDARLYAATRHQFSHLDRQSLANYNRGLLHSSPATRRGVSVTGAR